MDDDTDRLVLAKHWQLVEVQGGWLSLRMQDFESFEFYSARGLGSTTPPPDPANVKLLTLHASEYQRAVEPGRLIYFPARGAWRSEQTLPELLGENAVVDVARSFSRSLMCLLAPLVALLAISFTGTVSQVFTLPISLGALMSLDVVATVLIKQLAGGMTATISALLVAGALVAALLIIWVFLRQASLLRPTAGRA
jgi:hypothetical protein